MVKISYFISKIIKKAHIPALKKTYLDPNAKVGSSSHLVNVRLGRYSYIANFTTVVDADISNFCSIADNCVIGGAAHPIEWVSTSPVFHEGRNIFRKNFSSHKFETTKKTIIKNDVWIGSNCMIKSGVTIENGAIIGMGSVLTKDVGPYEIWGGNPAKLIRKRFDDKTIEKLLNSKWWEWDEVKLAKEAVFFNDLEKSKVRSF